MEWIQETYSKYEIDNLIIVGGESSKQKYPGPTVNRSLEKISQDNLEERLVEAGRGKEIIKYQVKESKKTINLKIEDDKFASEILKLLRSIDDKEALDLSNYNDINLELLNFLDNNDDIHLPKKLRKKIELFDSQKLISIISNFK